MVYKHCYGDVIGVRATIDDFREADFQADNFYRKCKFFGSERATHRDIDPTWFDIPTHDVSRMCSGTTPVANATYTYDPLSNVCKTTCPTGYSHSNDACVVDANLSSPGSPASSPGVVPRTRVPVVTADGKDPNGVYDTDSGDFKGCKSDYVLLPRHYVTLPGRTETPAWTSSIADKQTCAQAAATLGLPSGIDEWSEGWGTEFPNGCYAHTAPRRRGDPDDPLKRTKVYFNDSGRGTANRHAFGIAQRTTGLRCDAVGASCSDPSYRNYTWYEPSRANDAGDCRGRCAKEWKCKPGHAVHGCCEKGQRCCDGECYHLSSLQEGQCPTSREQRIATKVGGVVEKIAHYITEH